MTGTPSGWGEGARRNNFVRVTVFYVKRCSLSASGSNVFFMQETVGPPTRSEVPDSGLHLCSGAATDPATRGGRRGRGRQMTTMHAVDIL